MGELGGVDVRPSRTFVWLGRRRAGHESIVTSGRAPRIPRDPSPERSVHVGGVEITYAGSPAVTLPLSAFQAARDFIRRRADRRRTGS